MPNPKAVTRKEFEELNSSVKSLVEFLTKGAVVPTPTVPTSAIASVTPTLPITSTAAPDPKQEAAVTNAGPNKYQTDDEWDAIARDIIGTDKIDHTEVERKGGGVKFTVVIKNEYSNAPKEYLDRTKVDRRTREVGAEGTEGVTQYCKLIRANLARPNQK